MADLLADNKAVEVHLRPEPDNQWDSRAICFECLLEGRWRRIGYVVREVLDDVHTAILENKIVSVKFSWCKYKITWYRSGPGYYAGINVSRIGDWSRSVIRSQSTV